MKTLIVLLAYLMITPNAEAFLNMKPGLWEVKTKMKTLSGDQDPMARMKQSMAKMPPEQRKQIEEMMAKHGLSINGSTIKICYTKDMLKDAEAMAKNHQQRAGCTNRIINQTSTNFSMSFSCEDGSNGTGNWAIHGNESYDGVIKFTDKKGKHSEINHTAKFISSDCGEVKPLVIPKK